MRPLRVPTPALVLLCDRQRPPGAEKPSCGHHGADDLKAWLKARLKAEGLWGRAVRVAGVDCLDVCPKEGVVLSLDGGSTLLLVDAEADREALLQRVVERVRGQTTPT